MDAMKWMQRAGRMVLGVACLLCAHTVVMAQAFPNKPIKIIVPYPPGNASDVAARILGEELSRRVGQPVVVENKPGATGAVGAVYVAKSPPDGHTLLMTSTSFAISTALVANLPYNINNDFEPVVHVGGSGGMVLVVNPSFPANN